MVLSDLCIRSLFSSLVCRLELIHHSVRFGNNVLNILIFRVIVSITDRYGRHSAFAFFQLFDRIEQITVHTFNSFPISCNDRTKLISAVTEAFAELCIIFFLEPVFIRNVCGFSSIILLQTRQKSAGGLSPGKNF